VDIVFRFVDYRHADAVSKYFELGGAEKDGR